MHADGGLLSGCLIFWSHAHIILAALTRALYHLLSLSLSPMHRPHLHHLTYQLLISLISNSKINWHRCPETGNSASISLLMSTSLKMLDIYILVYCLFNQFSTKTLVPQASGDYSQLVVLRRAMSVSWEFDDESTFLLRIWDSCIVDRSMFKAILHQDSCPPGVWRL